MGSCLRSCILAKHLPHACHTRTIIGAMDIIGVTQAEQEWKHVLVHMTQNTSNLVKRVGRKKYVVIELFIYLERMVSRKSP